MTGLWWLPKPSGNGSEDQVPDYRVSGEFHGDGPWNLTTIGRVLSDASMQPFMSTDTTPTPEAIRGIDIKGLRLSLFDLQWSGGSWQLDNPLGGREKWHVGWYTSGKSWAEPDQAVDHVTVEFDVLDEWAGNRILTNDFFASRDGAFELPPATDFTAAVDGATVTLNLHGEWRASMEEYRAVRRSSFTIDDAGLRLDEVSQKWVRPLLVLMDLVTATSVRATGIRVRLKDISDDREMKLDVHPNLIQPKADGDASPSQLDMLTTLGALEGRGLEFPDLIQRYFRLYSSEKHKKALGFLSHSQSRILDSSTDSEFLMAIKAVELYHNAAIGGSAIPLKEHKERVDAIVACAPKEWRQWAESILRDKNSKGLKRRLQEVMDRSSSTSRSIEDAWPDFCRQMIKYRRRAAHGISTTVSSLGLRYHAGAVGLRWLLRHAYLLELGMSESGIENFIQNDHQFQGDIRLLEKWYGRISR